MGGPQWLDGRKAKGFPTALTWSLFNQHQFQITIILTWMATKPNEVLVLSLFFYFQSDFICHKARTKPIWMYQWKDVHQHTFWRCVMTPNIHKQQICSRNNIKFSYENAIKRNVRLLCVRFRPHTDVPRKPLERCVNRTKSITLSKQYYRLFIKKVNRYWDNGNIININLLHDDTQPLRYTLNF